MNPAFEYKILNMTATGFWVGGKIDFPALERSINALGQDGWELTSSFDTNTYQGQTREVVLIFKRKRA